MADAQDPGPGRSHSRPGRLTRPELRAPAGPRRGCPTGRWYGACGGGAGGGAVGCVRCTRGGGGWSRPGGCGRRSTAAAPSSSAPPSRPCRPPNSRTARTRSAVLRGLDRRRSVVEPRVPRACPVFVADPDRVHHDDPPSRAGVVAVSVSLRHQRSSVTVHRPRLASRRRATGRTRSPFHTTATSVRQSKTGHMISENVPRGGVQRPCRGATLAVWLEQTFAG
jgi:hypothetical protein